MLAFVKERLLLFILHLLHSSSSSSSQQFILAFKCSPRVGFNFSTSRHPPGNFLLSLLAVEVKIQLLHPLIGLLHISHWGGNSELLKLVKVTDSYITWVTYKLIIGRSGHILCAVHAQQQAIVTKTETTTTPRGLCFNLSQILEVDDIM